MPFGYPRITIDFSKTKFSGAGGLSITMLVEDGLHERHVVEITAHIESLTALAARATRNKGKKADSGPLTAKARKGI